MNKEKRFFRVRYGYNVYDQVSIEEDEVEKAIYAQRKKIPAQIGNKYINGSNIIVIEPHYHKHTGWHDFYEPKDGDDWKQIERDCPSYDGIVDYYRDRVNYLISNNQEHLIGKNAELPVLLPNMKTEVSEASKQLSDKLKV